MNKAEVFLFTSDYGEGWGAVLNEAMDSGCVVVASHAAGSVPYLIKDGENGFVYPSGNGERLVETLKNILDGKADVKKMSRSARETLSSEWNAERATDKLLSFCEAFFAGDYKKGICGEGVLSLAKAIPQKDMYHHVTREISFFLTMVLIWDSSSLKRINSKSLFVL